MSRMFTATVAAPPHGSTVASSIEHHRDVVLDRVHAVARRRTSAPCRRSRATPASCTWDRPGSRAALDRPPSGTPRKLGSLYQTRWIVKQLRNCPWCPFRCSPSPPCWRPRLIPQLQATAQHAERRGVLPVPARASLRIRRRRRQGARRAARGARLEPRSAEIRAEIASLHAREGRDKEAMDEARAALALDPHNREANRIVGAAARLHARRWRLPDGRGAPEGSRSRRLEQGRNADGVDFDPALEMTLARLYLRANDNDRAIAVLTGVVAREPAPEAWLLLAQAQTARGASRPRGRRARAGRRPEPAAARLARRALRAPAALGSCGVGLRARRGRPTRSRPS